MFSGKTEELIRRLKRAQIANQKVEIYKPSIDIRYDDQDIVSHNDNRVLSTPVENSQHILLLHTDADVVAIDEAQFFDTEIGFVAEQLASKGVRVIIAGATPSAQPAPGGTYSPTPTPSPTGTAKPTPGPSQTATPGGTAAKVLTLKVYFKGDSAVLLAAAKTDLRILAKKAKAYGLASSITVIGRVKETNDKSYDLRLSRQRATNVANFLKTLGVKGTYKLVPAGISPENKPISRRVEVTIKWAAK